MSGDDPEMSGADDAFFVAGGTLAGDAASYVPRQADHDLLAGLGGGEYCCVLTSRQMGKSSLMVRTAGRLRAGGASVALLDLTAVGQNLSAEQWYDGLLAVLARQLGLEQELEEFWLAHTRLGPLQRWVGALREVVLGRCPGRVVVFVDEIDAVRGLPFPTDEFFAAVRECHNRRTSDPAFGRLAFCLLGVATPSDLVRDARTTPFNVGRRVEVADFGAAEAAPLAAGLGRAGGGRAGALLGRVLHWTGGHPYLTQRLCRAAAGLPAAAGPADVDRLCEDLFLTKRARERDENLMFVRDRMLRGEADPAGLLDLYARVCQGLVPDDETNRLAAALRLAGVARVADGRLRVRNRIYERVFDAAWVAASMPDAERRRQRRAYRRGVARASLALGAVLAVVSVLGLVAWRQMAEARESYRDLRRQQAAKEEALAETRKANEKLEEQFYSRSIALAERELTFDQELGMASDALAKCPHRLRGWEWRYLMGQLDKDRTTAEPFVLGTSGLGGLEGVAGMVRRGAGIGPLLEYVRREGLHFVLNESELEFLRRQGVHETVVDALQAGNGLWKAAFSPSGSLVATAGLDGTVKLWETASGRLLRIFDRGVVPGVKPLPVLGLAFSPDGRRIASGSLPTDPGGLFALVTGATAVSNATVATEVKIWDVETLQVVVTLERQPGLVIAVAFSPDGSRVASSSINPDNSFTVFDAATGKPIRTVKGHQGQVHAVRYDPGGGRLASASTDGTVMVWDAETLDPVRTVKAHPAPVFDVAFDPSGTRFATAGLDGTARLWDAATGARLRQFTGHAGYAVGVAFTPDGTRLATAGFDRTVRLWDPETGEEKITLRGHREAVFGVAFSPDSRKLVSASLDGTARVWDATGLGPASRSDSLAVRHGDRVNAVSFSPDGKVLASAGWDNVVRCWDARSGALLRPLVGHDGSIWAVAFHPQGGRLASASWDRTVRIWDVETGETLRTIGPLATPIHCLAFGPDGRSLACGSWDGLVTVWDAASGAETGRHHFHHYPVLAVAVASTPRGDVVATGGADGKVAVWDVGGKEPPRGLVAHATTVHGLGFSPDGGRLATASWDRTVKVWEVPAGKAGPLKPLMKLEGHTDRVQSVAYSRDGTRIATSGDDKTIRLWDAATGKEVVRAFRHRGTVMSVAFSPDGERVAGGCASAAGLVNLWNVGPEAAAAAP